MWDKITQPCKGKPEITKLSVRIDEVQSQFCSKFLSPSSSLTCLFSYLDNYFAVLFCFSLTEFYTSSFNATLAPQASLKGCCFLRAAIQ